jgi:enoyl-CoA hydratase
VRSPLLDALAEGCGRADAAHAVNADEARAIGLVADVVPDGEVVEAALELAQHLCGFTPFATEMTKEVMWANLDAPSLEHAIHLENRTQTLAAASGDLQGAAESFARRGQH